VQTGSISSRQQALWALQAAGAHLLERLDARKLGFSSTRFRGLGLCWIIRTKPGALRIWRQSDNGSRLTLGPARASSILASRGELVVPANLAEIGFGQQPSSPCVALISCPAHL
jgi:hypothetical protein